MELGAGRNIDINIVPRENQDRLEPDNNNQNQDGQDRAGVCPRCGRFVNNVHLHHPRCRRNEINQN
jgi:hypothetical protein